MATPLAIHMPPINFIEERKSTRVAGSSSDHCISTASPWYGMNVLRNRYIVPKLIQKRVDSK